MKSLNTQIVIEAVDKLTSPLRGMSEALNALLKPIKKIKEATNKLSNIGAIRSLREQVRGLARDLKSTAGRAKLLKQSLKMGSMSDLKDMAKGLGKGAGSAMAALAGVGFGFNKLFIEPAAQFEKYNAILTTLEGSNAKVKKSMDWISDFAVKTPYELDQVTDAFVKLRANGMNPTDGLLQSLGDTAAAMGKPLNQAVEAMADAIVGENERLKEFGIKASISGNKIAYNYVDKSGKQQRKVVDKNNLAMIQSTLEAIFNNKYGGAMIKLSKTWSGMLSNLKDQWIRFATTMMSSGAFDALKEKLRYILDTVNSMAKSGELQRWAQSFSDVVVQSIKTIWTLGKNSVTVFKAIKDAVNLLITPFKKLNDMIQEASKFWLDNTAFGEYIGKYTTALMAGLGDEASKQALAINTQATYGAAKPRFAAARPTLAQKRQQQAATTTAPKQTVGGTIKLEISGAAAKVKTLRSHGGIELQVDNGLMPVGGY